ncbi:hypothetical protein ACFQ6C_25775 [Streptomyces sp. NPDC056454]|uniref:hypothetical protein n=1 Tax=Streptomyces sp. NPDC056454 TaxID=3345823 RepID=UPI0036CB9679
MPHITELTTATATAAGLLTPGARIARRYWPDDRAPHGADFVTADTVTTDRGGWVTAAYHWYTESGAKQTTNLMLAPDDVVAVVEMKPLGDSGEMTYAHHDDRLTLPGGYLNARPATMHGMWDAFTADGAPLAEAVTVDQGRALLAYHAAH